jgi:hypothetical protein
MNNTNEEFAGSISVSRDAIIGGGIKARGNSTFNKDVVIEGSLMARNIRGACKGLFLTEAKLNTKFPNPQQGWWAYVGTNIPAPIYVADAGQWTATGETGGTVQVDVDSISDMQSQIDTLKSVLKNGNADPTTFTLTYTATGAKLTYNVISESGTTVGEITFNLATQDSAGLMSAADKKAIDNAASTEYVDMSVKTASDKLQENIDEQIGEITNPLVGVLNAPEGVVEANLSVYFVMTAHVERKDGTTVDDPDTFSVTYDGTEVITNKDEAYKGSFTEGTHITKLTATKGNMSVEVTKTYTCVLPTYMGLASIEDADNITDVSTLGTKAVLASPSGSYTLGTQESAYLWIAIPKYQSLNSVKLGGYEVPMQLPATKDSYKYYRSSYPIAVGTYTFVLS